MISRYLAAYQLGYIQTVWEPFFDPGTSAVLTSDVSKAFPVPDAGLGAFAYSLETLSCFGCEKRWRTQPWLVLLFGLLTVPLALTSVILIMLQPVVVGAWCTLCLLNAFLMLIPIAFALDEVAATWQFLRYSKEKPFWRLLLQGGECRSGSSDHRSPQLDQPMWKLLRASAWGVTLPWNLTLATLLGVWLMFAPSLLPYSKAGADLVHIVGALVIVVTMLSYSEIARSARWINILLAALLLISPFLTPVPIIIGHEIGAALLLAALSIRRGPILEKADFPRS
jgi:hypothetical protein